MNICFLPHQPPPTKKKKKKKEVDSLNALSYFGVHRTRIFYCLSFDDMFQPAFVTTSMGFAGDRVKTRSGFLDEALTFYTLKRCWTLSTRLSSEDFILFITFDNLHILAQYHLLIMIHFDFI